MNTPETRVFIISIVITSLLLIACVGTLKTPINGEKTAVIIEGLGSMPYAKNAYNDALKAKGYTVYNTNWNQSGQIGASLCIGHSFGGGRLMKDDVTCDIVITLDARELNASKNDSYVTKHKVHYNFWEKKDLLRGYEIKGAINKEIKSNHIGLPKASFDEVMDILKN